MKIKILFSQAGANFTRNVGECYEVSNKEAGRLIKTGIAEKFVEKKDIELNYKKELKEVNEELQKAWDENKKLTENLENSGNIEPLKRKNKSLNDELKKNKTALKASETNLKKVREQLKAVGKKKS